MAGQNGSSSCKRSHVVLIPGFGAFDALGQVEYYAGITPLFRAWNTGRAVVLHYFDNFPTAAVVTRATRLRKYLAKRIARGEILSGDDVILIGHSTGGLDIRQLVSDLLKCTDERDIVDGGFAVKRGDILHHVRRVVFLSVPHWGTNIADWVRSHSVWREAVVAELRAAVTGSQVLVLDRIEDGIAGAAAYLTGSGLLRAVQDALREANERNGKQDPVRIAAAHEAASELALYLRHMASDFSVIDDLASERPAGAPVSPAHIDSRAREQELEQWEGHRITTLSYATVGCRPFRFVHGEPAPLWELAKLWTYPEFIRDTELSAGTDLAYRFCYRACAGGPFRKPPRSGKVTRRLDGAPRGPIELWDNDGIVNTASMLWPDGDNVLVAGDHLDIVGHYKPVEAEPGGGRKYRAYDSLKSSPQFGPELFNQVWTEIFDFCVGRNAARRAVTLRLPEPVPAG